MRSSGPFSSRRPHRSSISRLGIVVFALVACSTPSHIPPDGSLEARSVQAVERCSTIGVAACQAMALLSSGSAPTCSVSMTRDGRRTEICGSAAAKPMPSRTPPPLRAPTDATVYPVQISWSDNSDNESHFVIERCDQITTTPRGGKTGASCTGAWREIANVGANTTSHVDKTAKINQTYIYRIKAMNSAGSSGYTQEAAITTPTR